MSGLILPNRFTSQPPVGTLVDQAKAKELGVVYLAVANESGMLRDVIGGKDIVNPGGSSTGHTGRVWTFSGAQQSNKAITLTGEASLFVCARIKATAAQAGVPGAAFGVYNSGAQSGFGVGFSGSNKVGLAWITNAGAGIDAYSTGALNAWYDVYTNLENASVGKRAWINGRPATTTQGSFVSNWITGQNEIAVGAQHRSSGFLRNFTGHIEWAAVLILDNAKIDDALSARLYADRFPYNLFKSQSRRIFVASAGGGTTLAITGQEVTAGLGTVLPNINYSLGGQSVTTSVGALVANLNVAITGQVLPVSLGSQVASISTGLAGQAVPLSLGTITVFSSGAVSLAITGQSTMISLGSFIPNTSYSLSGQNISASINNLTSDIMYTLSGQSTPIVLGTVAASVNSTLVGQPVSLTLGSTSASISTVLNGQSVILAQSFLSPIITPSITGQGVLTGLGTITAVGGTNPQYSKNSNLYYNIGNDLSIMLGSPTITTWNNSGRPTGVKVGTFGFNTETNKLEVYTGSGWIGVLLT